MFVRFIVSVLLPVIVRVSVAVNVAGVMLFHVVDVNWSLGVLRCFMLETFNASFHPRFIVRRDKVFGGHLHELLLILVNLNKTRRAVVVDLDGSVVSSVFIYFLFSASEVLVSIPSAKSLYILHVISGTGRFMPSLQTAVTGLVGF